MSSIETIKSNTEFQAIFEKGHSIQSRYLVVYFLHNQLNIIRYGFCVGKRIGCAVQRNRVKRLLREVVRKTNYFEGIGMDLIIIARNPILNVAIDDITRDYFSILKKFSLRNNK